MGRFCLNCGHRIGAPTPTVPAPAPVLAPAPTPTHESPVVEPPWDPPDDLLPYDDEVPEHPDSALRGLAWLGWVVGAALLVALVFVLLRAYADSGDTDPAGAEPGSGQEPEAETQEESPEAPAPPEAVGRPANVARAATFTVPATAPPTTDFDGRLVGYEAVQMHDGLPATTWRMPGDGTGAVITITLPRPTVVSRVGLINGYAKRVSGVDWYPNNRRILSARWSFDNGSSILQTFDQRPDLQQIELTPGLTRTVTLTISAVTAPGAGPLGRDYTAVSEVAITGRRAR